MGVMVQNKVAHFYGPRCIHCLNGHFLYKPAIEVMLILSILTGQDNSLYWHSTSGSTLTHLPYPMTISKLFRNRSFYRPAYHFIDAIKPTRCV